MALIHQVITLLIISIGLDIGVVGFFIFMLMLVYNLLNLGILE